MATTRVVGIEDEANKMYVYDTNVLYVAEDSTASYNNIYYHLVREISLDWDFPDTIVRIHYEYRCNVSSNSVLVDVRVYDPITDTETVVDHQEANGTAWNQRDVDIPVKGGQKIRFYIRVGGAGAYAYLANCRMYGLRYTRSGATFTV